MAMAVTFRRLALLSSAIALAACATNGAAQAARWAAHGYLTPGANGDPEIIGTYDTESACRAAVEAWMSRQVVGNPVSGDCFPVDTH